MGIRQHDQLEGAAQVTGPQMQVEEMKSSKTPKHGHRQEFCTQSKAQIPKLQLRAKSRCIVCGQHANMAISSHSSMTQARSKCYTPWFALALEPKWQHVNKWYTHIDQARPDICRQTTYLRSGKARLICVGSTKRVRHSPTTTHELSTTRVRHYPTTNEAMHAIVFLFLTKDQGCCCCCHLLASSVLQQYPLLSSRCSVQHPCQMLCSPLAARTTSWLAP